MEANFIIIYDTTANSMIQFVSESVYEALGYTTEELVGTNGYRIMHPEEGEALLMIHQTNVIQERISSITTCRTLHKKDYYVLVDIIVHYCFDMLVCCVYVVPPINTLKRRIRLSTADQIYAVQPDGSIFIDGTNRDGRHHLRKIMHPYNTPWGINAQVLVPQEPRFCMVLNRFSAKSNIVFATSPCQSILDLAMHDGADNSIYNYISPNDREMVRKQIDLSKSRGLISRIRFDWMTHSNQLLPVETVLSCTDDGLVMVGRIARSIHKV